MQNAFVYGENDGYKIDYAGVVRPKEWKNIPIPVVEAIERLVMEFEAICSKLNRSFDGTKRQFKKISFEQSR